MYDIYWRCPNCRSINKDAWPMGMQPGDSVFTQPVVCSHCGVNVNEQTENGHVRNFDWVSKEVKEWLKNG